LHRASIRGSKKVAKKILMLGVDPNVADNAGEEIELLHAALLCLIRNAAY
jgi:hypothetical protein